jgi:hypothetical protein
MIRPSILIPWRISQARKAFMAPIVIALESIGDFWETWAIVFGANK